MLCGIFVGGKASRMGGLAKGLLPAPEGGEPLVVRLARLATELGLEPVLVGSDARYAEALPALRAVPDQPPGIGPLGGLSGLLEAAQDGPVIALACDLPRVSRGLLAKLASHPSRAAVLAPRGQGGFWEPLCARYDATLVRAPLAAAIARGVRSFKQLFEMLPVEALELSDAERAELGDWDTPEDLQR